MEDFLFALHLLASVLEGAVESLLELVCLLVEELVPRVLDLVLQLLVFLLKSGIFFLEIPDFFSESHHIVWGGDVSASFINQEECRA